MTRPSARMLGSSVSRSLAARISLLVFATTLISALAVAWTTASALRAFLRSKVEQKIPVAAAEVRDRLELWYAQRTLDAEVFARSATVVDGLTPLARARGDRADREALAAVEQYLRYILEELPHYTAIFVLDAHGERVLGVGQVPALERATLRRLAAAEDASISGMLADTSGRAVQAVSSPVRGRDERLLFTLHAVLPRDALMGQLAGPARARLGRALIFDGQGVLVAASGALPPGAEQARPHLAGMDPGAVHDYVAPDGARVVGSAVPIASLRWTLVVEEDYERAFSSIGANLGPTVGLNLGIVLALSGIAFWVGASLVRPLHALSACARRLRDGEEGVELPVVNTGDEVEVLARSFSEMVHSLKRANEALEQLAITDELTKIHNHRFFRDQLGKEISRCERAGSPLALVLADIDDFKALNDRHGHAVGDAVLEQLAALLVEQTRDHDLVARYGGEEFAILAPDTDRDGALALAEKLRGAVADARFRGSSSSEPIAVTVSVGVAIYGGDRQSFFQNADRALYAAKDAGKDCVVASDRDQGA